MRLLTLLSLILGITLLCFAAALLRLDRDKRLGLVHQRLAYQADDATGRLSGYLGRVESVLGTVAASSVVRRVTVDDRASAPARRETMTLLLHVHDAFAGATGEASLLDSDGRRILETVSGRPRQVDKDSAHLSGLLSAGLRRNTPGVDRTAPFRSPSTGQWVIGYLAPVGSPLTPDGALFVEITMASLGWTLESRRTGGRRLVVDRRSGRVLVDPRADKQAAGSPGPRDDRRFAALRGIRRRAGIVEGPGGMLSSFQAMGNLGDGNDWLVVATEPRPFDRPWWSPSGATLALGLIGIGLVLVGLVGLRQSGRRLERLANTDSLTGLPNRRSLMAAMESAAARASLEAPLGLLILDLDGFKSYNDVFGHSAGDALLVRLGAQLQASLRLLGAEAYRLGGDEFCVVGDGRALDELVAASAAALTDSGQGFVISASCGQASLPLDAPEPNAALNIADQRMYAQKAGGRTSTGRQLTDVLLRVLGERDPALEDHVDGVKQLALAVGSQLRMSGEQLERLEQAAALHDVGKMAIPDAILSKPGPLNGTEQAFMRRHTEIGERMLAAAPTLVPASRLVRSSHESWDGSGYPDGLAGEEIPLAARVIAVCDAYSAMISDRPYRTRMTPSSALAELDHAAGSQFDPAVVRTFTDIWHKRNHERVPMTPVRA